MHLMPLKLRFHMDLWFGVLLRRPFKKITMHSNWIDNIMLVGWEEVRVV